MKKILIALCSIMLCVSVGGIFAVNENTYAEGQGAVVSTELFVPSDIKVEPLNYDSEVLYFDSALKLISNSNKEKLKLKNELSGNFSIDYLPEKENGFFTAEKFAITFTDVQSRQSFSVNLEHGDTTNVYVEIDGQKVGAYYVSGAFQGLTTLCNSVGVYTEITAKKISVQFDPDTMSIYAGATGEKLSLVWSLMQEEIDGKNLGKTYSPFNAYTVDFSITDISAVKNQGEVLIYDINGCKFDSILIENYGESTLFANFEKNALVGKAYELPSAYVSDIVNGTSDNEQVSVTVTDKNKNSVAVLDGKFTPTVAGEYEVTYTYESVSKSYIITAFSAEPYSDFDILYGLNDEYPVGSEVVIPKMILTGGLLRYGYSVAKVAVYKDGVALTEYADLLSGTAFTFAQEGVYALRYYISSTAYVEYEISVSEQKVQFITDGLEVFYTKGAFIDASAFKVIDDGKEVDFSFYVQYPNGNKYSNKKFALTDVGAYVLGARYDDGQNVYNLTKNVVVNAKNSDFFYSNSLGVEASHGRSLMTGRNGVKIHFDEGDQLVYYSLPIDITSYKNIGEVSDDGVTKVRSTDKPIIELTIDPKDKGNAAASGINLYLTDAANPDNFIKITVLNKSSSAWSYMRAGATNQTPVGFYNDTSDKSFYYDGTYGYLTESYGTMLYHAVKGSTVSGYTAQDSKISIYYDNETKQILTHNARTAKTDIVVDLDDGRFTTTPWAGFESDTVYLSFSLAYVDSMGANATVYSIDGRSFENESALYSSNPEIVLTQNDVVFKGIKGRSFTVPQAKAYDCFGKELSGVVAKAYYEYSGKLIDLTIANGKFLTTKSGTYFIEYTAKDVFGNVGVKKIEVQVVNSYSSISMSIDDSYKQEQKVATEIQLCPISQVNVSNTVGVTKIVRTVYRVEGTKKVQVETNGDTLYTINPGKYYVEYVLTDGAQRSKTEGYNFQVVADSSFKVISSLPTFVGFIRGNVYEIPELVLVDYSKGNAKEQLADIYVDGELLEGNLFTIEKGEPEGKDAEETVEYVTIEYKCGDSVVESYVVPVKTAYKQDVEKLPGNIEFTYTKFLQDRFFISENGGAHQLKANGVVISSTKNSGAVTFVQPLASEKLSFVLDVNFKKTFNKDSEGNLIFQDTNVKVFKITLTDAIDKNKVLVIEFTTNPSTGYVVASLNGIVSQDLSASFVGVSAEQLSLRYDNASRKIVDVVTETQILVPKTYNNGKPFEGFSETVYASFSFECKNEGVPAELLLYSINGQNFSSSVQGDLGEPAITVNGKLNGVFSTGDKVIVPSAKANDVFGSVLGNGTFFVSVMVEKNGNSTYAKDVNGLLLKEVSPLVEYEIVFNEIGTYKVVYFAQDSNGVPKEVVFVLTVIHDTKPTIELNGKLPQQTKVGETISIPEATVNYFEQGLNNHYYVYVISPTYDIEIVKENSFVAKEAGEYTIRYFVLDSYGNYELVDYKIQVSK